MALVLIATTVVAAAPATIVYSADDAKASEEYQKQGLNASVTNAKSKNDISAIDELISRYSALYGVSGAYMRKIIFCESSFNPRAVGDGGYSRGLVQINSKYWPEITDEMAFDPEFAIEFLAQKLSTGQKHLWSCSKLI